MYLKNEREYFIEQLYRCHAHKLENLCFHYVGYIEEYHDVIDESIQETFMQAYRNYDTLCSHPNVEGWLVVTCMNRFKASLRKYRRYRKRFAAMEQSEVIRLSTKQTWDCISDFAASQENRELLETILLALNQREHDMVVRRFIKNKSFEEIAEEDHTTVSAVKAVLARLREKARRIDQTQNLLLFFIVTASFILQRHFKK